MNHRLRSVLPSLLLLLLPLLFLPLAGCMTELEPGPANHVFAHRGASGEATEHSRAAYDLALAEGAQWLEQDLVLSADGTLYVSHDKTPERMTGETRPFAELTDKEIDALRTADGQKILKLRDVFAAYRKKAGFVVEVREIEQVEPLFALIEEFGLEERMILQAWNTPALKAMQERCPTVRRMLLVKTQNGINWACIEDSVEIVAIEKPLMTEFNCSWIHQHGKEICVWTLNSEEELRRAIGLNVDCYFTDFPARALALEAERVEPTEADGTAETGG